MSEKNSKIGRLGAAEPKDSRLSPLDLRILDVLMEDARIPNKTLAELVGIAPSTCHGRVKALEQAGVITGYHATVDLAACGLPVRALVTARVHPQARPKMFELCQRLSREDEVQAVFLVGGDHDILLDVACASTGRLRDFINDHLGVDQSIFSTSTNIVFDHFAAS